MPMVLQSHNTDISALLLKWKSAFHHEGEDSDAWHLDCCMSELSGSLFCITTIHLHNSIIKHLSSLLSRTRLQLVCYRESNSATFRYIRRYAFLVIFAQEQNWTDLHEHMGTSLVWMCSKCHTPWSEVTEAFKVLTALVSEMVNCTSHIKHHRLIIRLMMYSFAHKDEFAKPSITHRLGCEEWTHHLFPSLKVNSYIDWKYFQVVLCTTEIGSNGILLCSCFRPTWMVLRTSLG